MYIKRIFIVIQILIGFLCFAGPAQDIALNYYYVQLKVVNLSGSNVDLYYNDLNTINTKLASGKEVIVYRTPITDDYPGFFAIQRENQELEIYTKSYINEVPCDFYYIILIYDEKIDFFSVDDIHEDYKNLSQYLNSNIYWQKEEINNKNITVEINNFTGESIFIQSNGYLFYTPEQTNIIGNGTVSKYIIELEDTAKCIYTINDTIFSLKYIYFKITYPKIFTNEELTSWYHNQETISVDNKKHKNITIILNGYDSGYEIKYE